MNKQEAIKKIDRTLSLPHSIGSFPYDYDDGLRYAKHIINQIEEPEKPVVPQFVAEWIEKCKTFKDFAVSLSFALQPSVWEANRLSDECIEWLTDAENQDIFARAWLDGYEVEKEKLYTAKLKLVIPNEKGYLNKNSKNNDFFIDDLRVFSGEYQTSFTQSELEELNVWDNPVFEVEEVSNE